MTFIILFPLFHGGIQFTYSKYKIRGHTYFVRTKNNRYPIAVMFYCFEEIISLDFETFLAAKYIGDFSI